MTTTRLPLLDPLDRRLACTDVGGRERELSIRRDGTTLTITAPAGELALLDAVAAGHLRAAVRAFLGAQAALTAPGPAPWSPDRWRLTCQDGCGRADRALHVSVDGGFVLIVTPAAGCARLTPELASPLWIALGRALDALAPPATAAADRGDTRMAGVT